MPSLSASKSGPGHGGPPPNAQPDPLAAPATSGPPPPKPFMGAETQAGSKGVFKGSWPWAEPSAAADVATSLGGSRAEHLPKPAGSVRSGPGPSGLQRVSVPGQGAASATKEDSSAAPLSRDQPPRREAAADGAGAPAAGGGVSLPIAAAAAPPACAGIRPADPAVRGGIAAAAGAVPRPGPGSGASAATPPRGDCGGRSEKPGATDGIPAAPPPAATAPVGDQPAQSAAAIAASSRRADPSPAAEGAGLKDVLEDHPAAPADAVPAPPGSAPGVHVSAEAQPLEDDDAVPAGAVIPPASAAAEKPKRWRRPQDVRGGSASGRGVVPSAGPAAAAPRSEQPLHLTALAAEASGQRTFSIRDPSQNVPRPPNLPAAVEGDSLERLIYLKVNAE